MFMGRKNIYDKDWRYSALYQIVDWCIRGSYRKVEVAGEENIPSQGAQIACPNHCNTLMDALVMLRGYKRLTVFGARADIFRKPLFAKLLTFIRILPMVRQRDGIRNVLQNNKTQEVIVDTLENDVRFCLFPEGTHRTRHSLQVLGKGAMRIALAANEKFGDRKPIYLLPVGLEYGDYFRYRSTSLLTYGKPINVTQFLRENSFESEPQAIEALRKALSSEMTKVITYIPSDDNYEGKWALVRMCAIDGRCHAPLAEALRVLFCRDPQVICIDLRTRFFCQDQTRQSFSAAQIKHLVPAAAGQGMLLQQLFQNPRAGRTHQNFRCHIFFVIGNIHFMTSPIRFLLSTFFDPVM